MADLNLNNPFQYAPGLAAYFGGQMATNTVDKGALDNQELSQRIAIEAAKEGRESQLFPDKLKNQQLINQGLEAEIPGKVAQSRKQGLDADLAQQTFSSNVASTNAKNEADVTKSKFEQMQTATNALLQAGPMLASVPAPLRAQALQQHLENSGIKWQNSPELQGIMNSDPNAMPQRIAQMAKALGDQALSMNPQARASMYGADVAAAASRYHSDKSSAATIEAARIAAAGKEKVAQIRTQQVKDMLAQDPAKAAVSAKTKAAIAARQYEIETDPTKKAELLDEAQFQQQLADAFERFAEQVHAGQPKPSLEQKPDGSYVITTPKTVPALAAPGPGATKPPAPAATGGKNDQIIDLR